MTNLKGIATAIVLAAVATAVIGSVAAHAGDGSSMAVNAVSVAQCALALGLAAAVVVVSSCRQPKLAPIKRRCRD